MFKKTRVFLISFLLSASVAYADLESISGAGKYLDDLNSAWPLTSDSPAQGDDHLRGLKNVIKLSLPSISGPVTATHTELNLIDGSVAGTAVASKAMVLGASKDIDTLDMTAWKIGGVAVTSTAAELNQLDGSPAARPTQQIFSSSDTYTKPSGLRTALVECWGGGGGGGGADGQGAGTIANAGGGGAGEYSRELIAAGSIGATETVTIGAGGTAGTGSGGGTGGTGGDVTFGSLLTADGATGGAGKVGEANPNTITGGAGGAGSSDGDLHVRGMDGARGLTVSSSAGYGGSGGHSLYGSGATDTAGNSAGVAGIYGGGGAGARSSGVDTDYAGGAGGDGLCIVTEYY